MIEEKTDYLEMNQNSFKAIIVDTKGFVFETGQTAGNLKITSDIGAITLGALIKCKNSNGITCGVSAECKDCEIRHNINLAFEKNIRRTIKIVKELKDNIKAKYSIDFIPFGDGQKRKIFLVFTEYGNSDEGVFFDKNENTYENFFYNNLNNLNLLIWSCDLSGKMKNMSESLLSILGMSREDILSGEWENRITIDLHKVKNEFENRKDKFYEMELKVIDKDREIRWFLIRIIEHTDYEGIVDGYMGKCTDITGIKNHQIKIDKRIKDVEVAKKNTDEFIAKLSHEVRTPLNGIIGMTELLIRTPLNADQMEDVVIVKNSANNMLRLINDMLDMTRIAAGKISLVNIKFNIGNILKNTVKSFENQAKGKGLTIETIIELNGAEIILGDPDRISQVLSNLIGNAIKFTTVGSISVRLKASRRKNMERGMFEYHFEVDDTGIGISKEDFNKLFKNYSQIQSLSKAEYKSGLGLGLFISKGLVELMGGEIWIKPKIGKGACFAFDLTMRSVEEEEFDYSKIEENEVDLSYNILVAEDNEMNRFVITKLLEGLNYKVEIVENGYEAVKAFTSKEYDMILMDIQMPIMDGIETTKKIRELEAGELHIPIIAVTAFAIKGDKERFLESGMDGYVSKPISLSSLKEGVSELDDLIQKYSNDRLVKKKHYNEEIALKNTNNQNNFFIEGANEDKNQLTQSTNEKYSMDLMLALNAALESENELAAEGIIIQLKELYIGIDSKMEDKLLKAAMNFRAGNFSKALEYLKL